MKSPTDEVPTTKLGEGIRLSLENARRLASASAAAAGAHELHAAAVLRYQAAEQVGKAKLLKDHLDAGRPVATDRKSAYRDHAAKFESAVGVVPQECLELWGPTFQPGAFQSNGFQTEPIPVDWQRRQDSLYLNWNPVAGDWDRPAVPEADVVVQSARRMVSFVDSALARGSL